MEGQQCPSILALTLYLCNKRVRKERTLTIHKLILLENLVKEYRQKYEQSSPAVYAYLRGVDEALGFLYCQGETPADLRALLDDSIKYLEGL